MPQFYTYILYNSAIDKYYVGSTQNIEKRVLEHNKKTSSIKYTHKSPGQWILIYKEIYDTRSDAMKREKEIKSMKSKEYIRSLIQKST